MTTTMMIATREDDDYDNGDGATGDEVSNDSYGATSDGEIGYDDIDDCNGQRRSR